MIPFQGFGFQWIDNADNKDDLQIARQVCGAKRGSKAEKDLAKYLTSQVDNPGSELNRFQGIAEQDFANKYTLACQALERITGKKLMSRHFDFNITTFPRVQYFYDDRVIMMYNSTKGIWGMPIDNFLHEALHFQFTYYWRENKDSAVSELAIGNIAQELCDQTDKSELWEELFEFEQKI